MKRKKCKTFQSKEIERQQKGLKKSSGGRKATSRAIRVMVGPTQKAKKRLPLQKPDPRWTEPMKNGQSTPIPSH